MLSTLTKRQVILDVPTRWKLQYYNPQNCIWGSTYNGDSEATYQQLIMLDLDTCNPEDIDAIIGNSSWTSLKCYLCGIDQDVVARLDFGDDYDQPVVDVCPSCAKSIVTLLENTNV